MIPIRDVNPTRITPWVTWMLIAACVLVFFVFQNQDTDNEQYAFLYRRAAIPCEITTGEPLNATEINNQLCGVGEGGPVFPGKSVWAAVFVSMFLHGGLLHLLFNMWSLWIFGNNVEEAFGRIQYAVLYLLGGIVATLGYVLTNPESTIPLVGASGAIAAVLGAYAVLFPRHQVLTLLGWILIPLPAAVFLAVWFFAQFGLGGTGTAWQAHVSGFLFGLAIAALFRGMLRRRLTAK